VAVGGCPCKPRRCGGMKGADLGLSGVAVGGLTLRSFAGSVMVREDRRVEIVFSVSGACAFPGGFVFE